MLYGSLNYELIYDIYEVCTMTSRVFVMILRGEIIFIRTSYVEYFHRRIFGFLNIKGILFLWVPKTIWILIPPRQKKNQSLSFQSTKLLSYFSLQVQTYIQDKCHQWSTRPDSQHASSKNNFHLKIVLFWKILKSDMCENSDHYCGSASRINFCQNKIQDATAQRAGNYIKSHPPPSIGKTHYVLDFQEGIFSYKTQICQSFRTSVVPRFDVGTRQVSSGVARGCEAWHVP